MHIIVFEEFEGREQPKNQNNSKFFRPQKRLPKFPPGLFSSWCLYSLLIDERLDLFLE